MCTKPIRMFCWESLHLQSEKQQKHMRICLCCGDKTTALLLTLLLAQQLQWSSTQLRESEHLNFEQNLYVLDENSKFVVSGLYFSPCKL